MEIKLFAMDVDGTLTNGLINVSSNGEIFKSFNVKDGYGIIKLRMNGVIPIVITSGQTAINIERFTSLGLTEIHQGVSNKLEILKEIMKKYDCGFANVAYIGDDENDLECLFLCAQTACPNDSQETVRKIVDYICQNNGGHGAVREFIERILKNY